LVFGQYCLNFIVSYHDSYLEIIILKYGSFK
jgi:hypothetical protein